MPNIGYPIKRSSKNSGAAALISGSPYKNALEEAQNSSFNKNFKKNLKLGTSSTNNQNKVVSKKKKSHVPSDSSSDSEEDVPYVDSNDDMDSEEEDADCLFCQGSFSSDKSGEKWIQCCRCYQWAHEECAGVRVFNFFLEKNNFIF